MATLTHGLSAAEIRALADDTDALDKALDDSATRQGHTLPAEQKAPEPAPAFSIDTDMERFKSLMAGTDDDDEDDQPNPAVASGVANTGRDTGPATLHDDDDREPFMPPPPAVAPDADDTAEAVEETHPVLEPVEPAGESKSGTTSAKLREAGSSAKHAITGLPTNVKLLGAAGLVILIILGTIYTLAGSDTDEPTATPPPARAPVNDTTDEAPIEQTRQLLQASTVSSSCPEGATATTLAFSTDERDAWVCPRAHGLDGTILNITFRDPVAIESIRFTPGFNYVDASGTDMWNRYRVVTKVRWKAGGQQWVQDVVPSRGEAEIVLDRPISTQALSMTILQTVDASETVGGGAADGTDDPFQTTPNTGSSVDATAVQNIQVYGKVI